MSSNISKTGMPKETPAPLENGDSENVSLKNYVAGFILAVLLTVISFGLVWFHVVSKQITLVGLAILAALQIFVHLRFFLHLDKSVSQRWNVLSFAFTAVLLLIFIAGTIWVMFTLNSRMM